ncbi:MAG: hypothetical protein ACP5D2_03785 [Candidatus Nanoarchaeia archaeon]
MIKKVILTRDFLIHCLNEEIDFEFQLMNSGCKIAVIREDLQHLKDWQPRSSHRKKAMLAVIEGIYNNPNIEKKTLPIEDMDNKIIELGKQGYYIASTRNDILNRVEKKVLIKDKEIVIEDGI